MSARRWCSIYVVVKMSVFCPLLGDFSSHFHSFSRLLQPSFIKSFSGECKKKYGGGFVFSFQNCILLFMLTPCLWIAHITISSSNKPRRKTSLQFFQLYCTEVLGFRFIFLILFISKRKRVFVEVKASQE